MQDNQSTDKKIIELFFARSEQAVTELADQYGAGCRRIANNILNNESDAEESVNDTYLAAWNTIPPQKPNPLRSYIYRIVRNIATARYHKNTAQKRNSSYDVALDELEACLASSDTPENQLSAKQLTEQINRFLAQLEKENRILFVRRYWYGDSVSKIAQETGMRSNTVSVRLARMRSELKRNLEKEEMQI